MRLELDIPDDKLTAAKNALIAKKLAGLLDVDHDPLDYLLVYIIGYVARRKQKEDKNDLSKNP